MTSIIQQPLPFIVKGSGFLLALLMLLSFLSATHLKGEKSKEKVKTYTLTDLKREKLKGKVKAYTLCGTQINWHPKGPIFLLNQEEYRQFKQDSYYVGREPYLIFDTLKHYHFKDSRKVNKIMDSLTKIPHDYDGTGQRWISSYDFYDCKGNKREHLLLFIGGGTNIIKYNKAGDMIEYSFNGPKSDSMYGPKREHYESYKHIYVYCKDGNAKGYSYINDSLVEKSLYKFTSALVGVITNK